MKKLLRKLFLYLFKEDFQRMKALERDLEGLIHRQKCATSLAEVRAERIRKLLGNIDVSVDVHQRSGSWAVVSLQGGKTDYIKFVDLDQRSIREISAFLRQFDRQNVQSDAEDPGIPNFTAHYLRMSNAKKFSPEYHVLQYVRFYLGDPQYQGEFVCVAEFDFT